MHGHRAESVASQQGRTLRRPVGLLCDILAPAAASTTDGTRLHASLSLGTWLFLISIRSEGLTVSVWVSVAGPATIVDR